MQLWHRVMSDLHRNTVAGLVSRCRMNGDHLSKTDHRQLVSLYRRYLDAFRVEAAQVEGGMKPGSDYNKIRAALKEAEQLDKIADQMTDRYTKTMKKGNVEFVDNP